MADDLIRNLRSLAKFEHADLSIGDEAADAIESQAAEITRLQSGGCARDQTTTQYCAEAVGLAAEAAELRAEVERLRALTTWRPIGPEAFDGRHWMLARHMGEPWGWVYGCGYYARVHGIEGWVVRGLCDPPGELGLGYPTHYAPLRRLPAPPAPESSDA